MGQSRKPTVFGAPYSVDVRSVRLTLEEKAVDYDLVPVDIFAAGGPPREQAARNRPLCDLHPQIVRGGAQSAKIELIVNLKTAQAPHPVRVRGLDPSNFPYGPMGPPTLFTIPVLRYMKTYGLSHEQLAMVSVVQRE
jgi:hypothetical protein